jgi:hypothetical protein
MTSTHTQKNRFLFEYSSRVFVTSIRHEYEIIEREKLQN